MRGCCVRIVLCWLLAAASAWAHAAPLELGSAPRYELGAFVNILKDPGGTLRLEDVLQPAQQARFQAVGGSGPSANFGMNRGAVWLRVQLRAPAAGDPRWLLELAYPPLDHLELYSPDPQGGWQRQVGGDREPFTTRAVAHRNHVLPVWIPPQQGSTLYLRLASEGVVAAPLRLWRPQAMWQFDQAAYAVLALYFGVLVGLLLYNLLLFVSVRDPAYLVYVLFVAAMGLAQGALTGLGTQFLWPEQVWWNSVAPHIGVAFAGVFALLFARRFLESRDSLPLMDRALRVQVGLWLLTVLAAAALPYVVSAWMLMVLAPLGIVSLVATGVLAMRRGHGGARHYLAAWAVLLMGVATLLLHNSGLLASNRFTSNSLLIGSAIEMVLLSFALADRINVARRQREQAQARLAAEQAMVEALFESERKLKTALEERELILREREAILNNAVVGIVLSVRRRHEWVNQKFADMLGYPRQVLIGQGSDYLHPDTESWQRFGVEARATLIADNTYTCEMELKRRNGELFWVQMGGSCVRPHDPDSGVIWTFLDVTGRKKSDAEMREALEQQKALNELRSRFVAMTSHEFRTPLAAILSAEEVLRHYGERLPERERLETLDGIAAGVQRMSRMLDRVLLLGRADAQLLEFQPATVDLRALGPKLVEEARQQHPQGAGRVVFEAAPEVGPGLYDEKLLRHVFGNLLSNAIKYSPKGGSVRFDVQREGAETVFRVRDQGIGIPPEEVPHLFQSFHRASNVGEIQGTGLGLAIVKNAVERHGGTVAVESRLGAGTTFTVRIPGSRPAPG
ncbi:MAG TPA: 7TM diverse intracellular signaling domain-containing protein [Ramlibacter sp.]|uniref:sensor histidine kinase n=1 Tax=Ramlibacter sp. TaxID=1917967 RepID=UPI002ED28505